ncbi:MAG: MAPEG family protein [Rhodobacteraceae bacterium]|nr:MAPEG family protein [Paracoccaceae bacterium]
MNASMEALALYAGLSGLIGMWLLANVGKTKHAEKVSIGDGGSKAIIRAMRGQANFVENVPITLILLSMMVFLGVPVWLIHILGAMLVVGRFFHAYHFIQSDAPRWQRALGFCLSFLVLIIASLGLIGLSIWGMIS